ncbi:ComEC family competence protein [Patescibacteria group bacterium]|nr:ComEC family competence protein [Patescibacteria group bacterium]
MSKSKIFFYSCLFFIVGVGLASYLFLPLWAAFAIFLAGCGFLFFGWPSNHPQPLLGKEGNNKKIFIIIGLGGIFLFLGILRFTASTPAADENQISFYNGDKFTFSGIVAAEPDTREAGTKLKIKSEKISPKADAPWAQKVEGNVLVNAQLYPVYHYGDELEVTCKLQKPEPIEDFAYDKYLAKENIYSVCYWPEIKLLKSGEGNKIIAGILFIKEKLVATVNRILPEPQAAFLGGLLYGAKRGIPQSLMDMFSITGTTHIVAISGYNITILAVLLLQITKNIGVGRKKSFWIALSGILFFVILTGAQASVVRAALMGLLVLFATQVGRLSKIKNALLLAAAVMLIFNPKILVFDVGFQLSFAATIGLVYLSPIFEKYLEKAPSIFGIKESFATTMSAIVLTLPLILYTFGRVSFVAPLANILILPMIPLAMALGTIAVFGGIIFSGLGQIIGWLAWLVLSYIIEVVRFLAKIPWASGEAGKMHWVFLIIFYFLISWFIWRKSKNLKPGT